VQFCDHILAEKNKNSRTRNVELLAFEIEFRLRIPHLASLKSLEWPTSPRLGLLPGDRQPCALAHLGQSPAIFAKYQPALVATGRTS
jgi:hypothetical protein